MVRNYDVITIGDTTMDAFMTLSDSHEKYHLTEKGELCFRHGEKINVERYDFSMGGNATNVAVGMARLGLKATLCSEIGDDEMSIKIRNSLAKENIERLFMIQTPGRSNFSVIINYKGERTIFSEHIEREHNFQIEDATAKCVYITSLGTKWHEPYEKALDFAIKQKAIIAFNPGNPQFAEGSKEIVHKVLEKSHILFLNKEEAELLLFKHYGEKDDDSDDYIKKLAVKLQKIGPQTVVITNGQDGSYCLDKDEFYTQEMLDGKPVERTGAGDSYTAGFLAATIYGLPVKEAMKWGAINAASVVAHIGAEEGLLTKDQMEEKLK